MSDDQNKLPQEVAKAFAICGILAPASDPDDFPILEQMPHGFASFMGSHWSGSHEWEGIVDAKIVLGRKKMRFVMTVGQAVDMRAALDAAIAIAEEAHGEAPSYYVDEDGNAITSEDAQ